MGNLPRMKYEILYKVRDLIESRCCNYDQGNCIALDDGEECICPQYWALSLLCKYFRYAVLPNDLELEATILGIPPTKYCCICGKPIFSKSNRVKYCPDCAKTQRKKKEAQRKRDQYWNLRI